MKGLLTATSLVHWGFIPGCCLALAGDLLPGPAQVGGLKPMLVARSPDQADELVTAEESWGVGGRGSMARPTGKGRWVLVYLFPLAAAFSRLAFTLSFTIWVTKL